MAQLMVDGIRHSDEYVGHSSNTHVCMSRLWTWLKHLIDQADPLENTTDTTKIYSTNAHKMVTDRK